MANDGKVTAEILNSLGSSDGAGRSVDNHRNTVERDRKFSYRKDGKRSTTEQRTREIVDPRLRAIVKQYKVDVKKLIEDMKRESDELSEVYVRQSRQYGEQKQMFDKFLGDIIKKRTDREGVIAANRDKHFQKFGSVLNDKALDFLASHSNIPAPTFTSILTGYEMARKSAADSDMKRIDSLRDSAERTDNIDNVQMQGLKDNMSMLAEQFRLNSESQQQKILSLNTNIENLQNLLNAESKIYPSERESIGEESSTGSTYGADVEFSNSNTSTKYANSKNNLVGNGPIQITRRPADKTTTDSSGSGTSLPPQSKNIAAETTTEQAEFDPSSPQGVAKIYNEEVTAERNERELEEKIADIRPYVAVGNAGGNARSSRDRVERDERVEDIVRNIVIADPEIPVDRAIFMARLLFASDRDLETDEQYETYVNTFNDYLGDAEPNLQEQMNKDEELKKRIYNEGFKKAYENAWNVDQGKSTTELTPDEMGRLDERVKNLAAEVSDMNNLDGLLASAGEGGSPVQTQDESTQPNQSTQLDDLDDYTISNMIKSSGREATPQAIQNMKELLYLTRHIETKHEEGDFPPAGVDQPEGVYQIKPSTLETASNRMNDDGLWIPEDIANNFYEKVPYHKWNPETQGNMAALNYIGKLNRGLGSVDFDTLLTSTSSNEQDRLKTLVTVYQDLHHSNSSSVLPKYRNDHKENMINSITQSLEPLGYKNVTADDVRNIVSSLDYFKEPDEDEDKNKDNSSDPVVIEATQKKRYR